MDVSRPLVELAGPVFQWLSEGEREVFEGRYRDLFTAVLDTFKHTAVP